MASSLGAAGAQLEEARVETVFCLSGDVPNAERCGDGPDRSDLQPGAVVLGSIRQVCFLRKISGGGAVLHLDSPVEPGACLELELMTGEKLTGTVAWRQGAEVGLRFDEPLDVFAIIARDLVSQPGERRRMPRIELRCPAVVETRGGTQLATTRDVSQGGAKIDITAPLAPEEPVRIILEDFRALDAVVRWSNGPVAGIAFVPELEWQELMPWLKAQRDAALRTRPPRPAFEARAQPSLPATDPEPAPEGSVALNLPARVREGTRRWNIEVASITARSVQFDSFAALRLGTLLWIVLPGLEGWPARIVGIDGYRFTCEFTQPLHPAVLERILALAGEKPA